jgi:teichoic acid transport system ATP-binding protein
LTAADTAGVDTPLAGGPARSIVVDAIDVTYRIYRSRRPGLRDILRGKIHKRPFTDVEAVRGVSLEVHNGESLGIVGPNGSGKSTLLRAIAGLMPVNAGSVWVRTQPTLLGVNAALRPAMSGRRNIEIGLLALGLRAREIPEVAAKAAEFSELGDFIEHPMDTYSTGMRARLHFAIATAVVPDILLIDEALVVGDRKFRERSAARIDAIRRDAGTIVLVSHNLGEIVRSCDRAIWFDGGRILMDGPAKQVVEAYESS